MGVRAGRIGVFPAVRLRAACGAEKSVAKADRAYVGAV
jgi:hypothetical protein